MQTETSARPPYQPSQMRHLLMPQSVALVGASDTAVSLGGRTLANLRSFPGTLYPVNGRYAALAGLPCYPSVAQLPQAPECVVIAVPGESVEAVVADCAERGVGAVVIFASGYGEIGTAEGEAAQRRLMQIASAHGMRIVGPNCVGVAHRAVGLHAAFAEFPASPQVVGARIGLVAQSGALGLGLSQAGEHGTSISHVLTCGNSCDVDVADYVAWLAEDDTCDVIALVFEGLAEPGRLAEAARRATAAGKRIVVCKLAASEAGRAAARFHTGTATGDAAAYSALFAREGMIEIKRIEALMETAAFFAKAPMPVTGASGAAIVSGSGGTAILAVDAAARHGVATPQPSAATMARLVAAIPPFGSPRNPCDATAQATRNPESLLQCADAMLADPHYGALVIPWGRAQPASLLPGLGALAERHGKPVCLVWMSQSLEGPAASEAERHPRIALFRSLDACFGALAHWWGLGAAAPFKR